MTSAEYCSLYWSVAAVVGVAWLAALLLKGAWHLLSFFRAYFLSSWLGLGKIDLSKYGTWAVVTGASEGIGRSYALELARQGLNVVLMSRSKEKLQRVADEIREKFKREVLIMPVDFSGGFEIYGRISKQLERLADDIGVLVNNVGMFYETPYTVTEVPPERLYAVAQVNTQPAVQMSHIFLPSMLKKGKGVIINIASAASLMAVPQMTVYSATKIFTGFFSDGLRKEYGHKGIIVQNVMPFLVATSMSNIKRTSFLVPSAMSYVRTAVASIGLQDNTFGCVSHAMEGYMFNILPNFILTWLQWRETTKSRMKYLRKKAKLQ